MCVCVVSCARVRACCVSICSSCRLHCQCRALAMPLPNCGICARASVVRRSRATRATSTPSNTFPTAWRSAPVVTTRRVACLMCAPTANSCRTCTATSCVASRQSTFLPPAAFSLLATTTLTSTCGTHSKAIASTRYAPSLFVAFRLSFARKLKKRLRLVARPRQSRVVSRRLF